MGASAKMRVRRFGLLMSVLPLLFAGKGLAMECYECHGSKAPSDYRPVDAQRRDIATGGFKGNHRTHMKQDAIQATCTACHPGSDQYTSSHRNGMIEVSADINNSNLQAVYRNGSTAFPQRPEPRLGSCTNVNCHFERETKVWGSAPLEVPDGCAECHGSPPGGGDGGAAGSHGTHDLYYAGVNGCVKCHANHLTDQSPFAHATSAGRRNLVVVLQNPATSARGSYSGPLDDYLPKSQTNQFGSCSNIYCHSPGNKTSNFDPPNRIATWGGSLSCNGCHKDGAGDPMVSGSHPIHLQKGYGCAVCHAETASDNTTITNRLKHVNGSVNVAFSAPFTGMLWDSTHKTCIGTCHSDGRGGAPNYTPTWAVPNTHGCSFCHSLPPATGAHLKHMPSPANYGLLHQSYSSAGVWSTATDYAFGCANCHPKDAALHVNGSVDLSLDNTEGGQIKGKNRVSTRNGGYTQATRVSVVCSASYCHGGSTDSYSYWSMDGSGEPILVTVTMHPTPQTAASPDWYGGAYSGDRCAMCHGNPPTGGAWHSGSHANQDISAPANQCQLCHSNATSTNGRGTVVTNKSVHLNGTIDTAPVFQSSCFGCH